jgi:alkylhydroperoxidase family enzyme
VGCREAPRSHNRPSTARISGTLLRWQARKHTLLTDLDRAILASRASTSVEVRASVADYCRALTRDRSTPNPFTGALAVWVEKVARHAYKTLPAEVTALRDEGLSEDEIFELTVAAAYGAARGRYDQALTALEEGYRP